MRDKVRKHFYFSGDVQMVGFRYQAKYAADDLGLTGCCTKIPYYIRSAMSMVSMW